MSDLATHVTNGETGEVTTPVPPVARQNPNSVGEISHTTSVEGLQELLYANYLYLTTLTVDPSMKAGYTFGYIKNHPFNCNLVNSYVAKMFQHWDGGMKLRARFGANFTNGGSFRIGFLPPSFPEATVANGVPLSVLTSYPNIDLDPKNTDFIHFEVMDQRKVMYHEMDDLSTDGFGGWIVFYVVMPLVSTLNSQGNVSLVIEAAGNYEFRQLSPSLTNTNVITGGPLTTSLNNISCQVGVDSVEHYEVACGMMVCKTQTTGVKAGFYNAIGVGGRPPTDYPGCTFSRAAQNYRSRYSAGSHLAIANSHYRYRAGDFTLWYPADDQALMTVNRSHLDLSMLYARPEGVGIDIMPSIGWEEHDGEFFIRMGASSLNEDMWSKQGGNSTFVPVDLTADGLTSIMQPIATGESIVLFVEAISREYNIQTARMSFDLVNSPRNDNMSYVYALKAVQGGTIMTLRLNPNGMWTTSATATDTMIPFNHLTSYYLEFQNLLPVGTPLPGSADNRAMFALARMNNREHREGMPFAAYSKLL